MPKDLNTILSKNGLRYSFIGVCLLAFSYLTFWLRTLPISRIVSDNWVNLLGNDPWYSLRQIEQMALDFPAYSWFDPMTHFPLGEVIYWGPLFRLLAVVLVILAGASTRPEIMYVASFLPPLMAVAMVPMMYGIGAKLVDWKTGLVSAGFIAIVGGQYAYRSLFGFVDHHIAETLFSTLFCLCFIIALLKLKESGVSLTDLQSLKNPVLIYPALAGVAFLLGFYNMTTMVMFGFIVAVYTLVQMILDHVRKQASDYLVLTNCVTFLVVILGIIPFGLKQTGLGVGSYSPGHILVYSLIIIGTLLLYGISRYLTDKPWYFYPGALAGVSVLSLLLGFIIFPTLVWGYIGAFTAVFGMHAVVLTVQEAMPWQFANAVSVFSWGWILVAGGIIYLLYRIWKKNDAPALFTLVWFALIFLATTRQVRFEYYLAANIALMAALAVGGAMQFWGRDLLRFTGLEKFLMAKEQAISPEAPPEAPEDGGKKGKKQKQKSQKKSPAPSPASPLRVGLLIVTFAIALLFVYSGATANYTLGSNVGGGMNSDWKAALTWMGENTPDPGVDYYAMYDSPQARDTFEYPPEAYGVLSWWDYGHWITFVSKRIPHANPFQRGATTAANFFIETDADTASAQLDELGIRYVITDIEMTTGKFWAMTTWHDPVNATAPFQTRMLYEESEGSYSQVSLQRESYFQTMIQRLHVFDGSAVTPEEILVVQSAPASSLGVGAGSTPVITGISKTKSVDEARAYIAEFEKTAAPNHSAEILTPEMFVSSTELDALQRFRLVYESPKNVLDGGGDIRYVKIFEFVPGATVQGEGMIEVPIKTNTGRTFTYRQESRDGVFVLPYPTEAGPDDVVVATGPYRIVETGQEISVPYRAVMEGLRI
ncbi:MAG: Oligosaccharyl transferase, STT3 subunit [Methanomicrobiales archaeon 53_19]|uniref:oligosaccharyl transferase, archaeosortase A system-associated n=1 Tax=Methanocalculus sp. TaxID=2004547 RepID=UPI0007468570|nr:oligosaccharyl transferase, archaeosortase A system-associated [Methanocalculus sp.]KUL01511.1 MAG: Oligosaccharyl transferase, STT3 subunit [Methanomicrobiales archaeon 53_19]HIJ06509.1 oligosaccharyl transferase, archaeosortase A system-associated [Methanocalculus sp.]